MQSSVLSCHGRNVSRKTGGVWRNSSCRSSRVRKRIWKSRTEVWQTDEHLACGWERATSRTSTLSEQTMELCMREVHDDSQSTAGQKRTSSQPSRPHRSRGRQQPMMQQIPEQYQKYLNTRTRMKKRTTTMVRTKNHPTSQTTRIMTWREETLPEPDTTATSSSSRGEKRTETQRECVRGETADDEVTKATNHTCPAS